MRNARVKDKLKKVAALDYPQLSTLQIEDPLGILPASIELSAGVTLLVGLNGSGKSRMLTIIDEQMGDGSCIARLHSLCEWLVLDLNRRDDVARLGEEQGLIPAPESAFSLCNDVVRRRYDEIEWASPEIEGSPFEAIVGDSIFPYIRVGFAGRSYDMFDMGMGELAAHVLVWTLHNLPEDKRVVVLDEPDTFFPGPSQRSLFEALVAESAESGRAFVVSSHSREAVGLIREVPGAIKVLVVEDGTTILYEEGGSVDAAIGTVFEGEVRPSTTATYQILVEDQVAAGLASELSVAAGMWERCSVTWVGGSGTLDRLARDLPRRCLGVDVFPVLLKDGDQRPDGDPPSDMGYLPGREEYETEFRESVVLAGASALAGQLGLDAAAVASALAMAEGSEPHSWFERVQDALHVGGVDLARACARTYIARNPDTVTTFRSEIARLVFASRAPSL